MRARLHNPVTGLFTTTDPITGANPTDYAYPQDPINQQDVNGRNPMAVAAFGAAALAAFVVITVYAAYYWTRAGRWTWPHYSFPMKR